jgi:uncharacterized membrane protein YcaP (DUF421 family)
MSSQLGRNELAALVSLAAAIGVPMMAPDRGLLPALVIAGVLITIQRSIARLAFKNQSFERFTQGNVSTLIIDAVIDVAVLESVGLSQERMFAELRCNSIRHLGEVERLYMEANGAFTLIVTEKPTHGLSTLPPQDRDFIDQLQICKEYEVCGFCGKQHTPNDEDELCPNCYHKQWVNAVM